MTSNVEDFTPTTQQRKLQAMSDSFVEVVSGAEEPLTTRDALDKVSKQMNILVSEAKYGLTYAKTIGRVHLNQSTMRLTAGR
jgi:hypothetical protein